MRLARCLVSMTYFSEPTIMLHTKQFIVTLKAEVRVQKHTLCDLVFPFWSSCTLCLCGYPPSLDLPTGSYIQDDLSRCSSLCEAGRDCCDLMASCKCGTHTGQYDCICEKGYYGKGLQHECTGRSDAMSSAWSQIFFLIPVAILTFLGGDSSYMCRERDEIVWKWR